jgi:TolA-binding protein
MKIAVWICLIACAGMQSCKSRNGNQEGSGPEPVLEIAASGRERLYGYADSIALAAARLEKMYDAVISDLEGDTAGKIKKIKPADKARLDSLEQRINELSLKIENLAQKKEITEDEYRSAVVGLDLSGVAEGSKKLRQLGIKEENTR